jgi:glycosyltransferase involved in cell wall biosynthesis
MPFTTTLSPPTDGVSVVLPVCNGEPWLSRVLTAMLAEDDGRPFEVIAIDDRSRDGSAGVLASFNRDRRVRVVDGAGRGAAAALNLGLRLAQHPLVAQLDQDVIVEPGWLATLAGALEDPSVGAAQGYYVTNPEAGLSARVMGLDLEQRYARIESGATDHVCTGNTVYRADALRAIGGFDESLGYGYDNDVSYRLQAAGYRLLLCRDAESRHHWREGLWPYLVQQYGFGYGRLDLVWRHVRRLGGDAVSPALMMLHPVLLAASLSLMVLGPAFGYTRFALIAGGAGMALLALERAIAGIVAARRFRDPAALAFPVYHFARDLAWVAAMACWATRRLSRQPARPGDSMRPRPAGPAVSG